MAMGIVSDSDFDSELKNLNKPREKPEPTPIVPSKVEILDAPHRGRTKGDNNVPESLRKLISETANLEGRTAALQLASSFGISPSSVSAYTSGQTSTASETKSDPIVNHLTDAKAKLSRKARAKMKMALAHITEDKLEAARLKDISGVARDMAVVIKSLEPPTPQTPNGLINNGPAFVFFTPQQKSEEEYPVVIAKEG